MDIQAILTAQNQALTAQNQAMISEVKSLENTFSQEAVWKRFGNCPQEALLTFQKIKLNLENNYYITNRIYYYNYGTGHLDGCIKATRNYWKVRLIVAHGFVDPLLTSNPSDLQALMTLKQQTDETNNPESASMIQQNIDSASYRPPYQTYMINQSVCGVNSRLNRRMWLQLRNRLSELGHYLNNRHNLAECNEVLSDKSVARAQDYPELTTDTAYKNVIKRSLRNLVGDVPSEHGAYMTSTAGLSLFSDPWNLEINNSNTHVTNSSINLNTPLGLGIVPTMNDNNNVPVINGVLCLTPIEINTLEQGNNPILPTFTFLTPHNSIQMQHLLSIDQIIHSIYPRGFPTERKNDKYIVANISCRGFSRDFSSGEKQLEFIKTMRQETIEQHIAESPRSVGQVDPHIWSGGKRKKTRRKRRKRKSKKNRKSRKKRKSRKRRKSRRRKRK